MLTFAVLKYKEYHLILKELIGAIVINERDSKQAKCINPSHN